MCSGLEYLWLFYFSSNPNCIDCVLWVQSFPPFIVFVLPLLRQSIWAQATMYYFLSWNSSSCTSDLYSLSVIQVTAQKILGLQSCFSLPPWGHWIFWFRSWLSTLRNTDTSLSLATTWMSYNLSHLLLGGSTEFLQFLDNMSNFELSVT